MITKATSWCPALQQRPAAHPRILTALQQGIRHLRPPERRQAASKAEKADLLWQDTLCKSTGSDATAVGKAKSWHQRMPTGGSEVILIWMLGSSACDGSHREGWEPLCICYTAKLQIP